MEEEIVDYVGLRMIMGNKTNLSHQSVFNALVWMIRGPDKESPHSFKLKSISYFARGMIIYWGLDKKYFGHYDNLLMEFTDCFTQLTKAEKKTQRHFLFHTKILILTLLEAGVFTKNAEIFFKLMDKDFWGQ